MAFARGQRPRNSTRCRSICRCRCWRGGCATAGARGAASSATPTRRRCRRPRGARSWRGEPIRLTETDKSRRQRQPRRARDPGAGRERRFPSGGIVVEIGTFDGRTTLNLAINAAPVPSVHARPAARRARRPSRSRRASGNTSTSRSRARASASCDPALAGGGAARSPSCSANSATFDWSPYRGRAGPRVRRRLACVRLRAQGFRDRDAAGHAPGGIVLWHDWAAGRRERRPTSWTRSAGSGSGISQERAWWRGGPRVRDTERTSRRTAPLSDLSENVYFGTAQRTSVMADIVTVKPAGEVKPAADAAGGATGVPGKTVLGPPIPGGLQADAGRAVPGDAGDLPRDDGDPAVVLPWVDDKLVAVASPARPQHQAATTPAAPTRR